MPARRTSRTRFIRPHLKSVNDRGYQPVGLPGTQGPQATGHHADRGAHAAATESRDPALDGVLGLAILLVLVHHLVYSSGIDRGVGLDLQVFRLAHSLWLGVDLFFVLSGFLITGILYDARGSSRYFRNFYGRRVLRIFPLDYGFLVLAMVFFPPRGLFRSS